MFSMTMTYARQTARTDALHLNIAVSECLNKNSRTDDNQKREMSECQALFALDSGGIGQ